MDGDKFVRSLEAEFQRYKAIADAAMAQLSDEQIHRHGPGEGSSVAVIAWHVGGNLRSRFTDFLTSDGEKPWRDRDGEFEDHERGRAELLEHWERGWSELLNTLSNLGESESHRTVEIRGTPFRVDEALHRALAHTSYHVGQIVYLAKAWRGDDWQFLSIAPGQSKSYNQNPTRERPADFTEDLRARTKKS